LDVLIHFNVSKGRCAKMKMKISDWVQGKTKDDEMIFGFVEEIDSMNGVAAVHVVQSDNEERVGRKASLRIAGIKPVPAASFADNEQIDDVIDLALATGDKAWFMELTEGRKTGRPSATGSRENAGPRFAPVNRIGKFV